MKIKYLVLLVLLVPVGALADDDSDWCGGICPKVIVSYEIVNKQSGSLGISAFSFDRIDEKRLISVGGDLVRLSPMKGVMTLSVHTKNLPIPYKIGTPFKTLASDSPLYSPYLPENGGLMVFATSCEGTLNLGDVKECSVVINDGYVQSIENEKAAVEAAKQTERDALKEQIKQEIILSTPPAVVQQEVPIMVNLRQEIQQTTTSTTTTIEISQQEQIEQLKAQLASLQQQIVIILGEIIRILRGRLAIM